MDKIFSGSLSKDLQAVAVIMAGGSGTRFWPLSRESLPKQFLPLTGSNETLIQATARRLEKLVSREGVLVVTACHQAHLVREQLEKASVLSEPCARNTAPCIGFSALCVLEYCGDIPMICVPSDHMIWPSEELVAVLKRAVDIVRKIGRAHV